MTTMNISMPDTMKAFVDAKIQERGYGTSSPQGLRLTELKARRFRRRAFWWLAHHWGRCGFRSAWADGRKADTGM